ncbi:MAG: cupin domain-containing protein [Acidimicrobiia bacterium]
MSDTATVIDDVATRVEIPEHGTLSKVLYRDDRLRVILFAFDAGQELTSHAVPLAAVIQVVSGKLRLTLGDATTEVGAGAWVHMPPKLSHAVHALEPAVMLLSMLSAV